MLTLVGDTYAPITTTHVALIRSVITTPANVNDTVPADGLIRGDERAVWRMRLTIHIADARG